MVAYTSPDCLPYFECTDSPCLNTGTVCEPSTVWCDLTALLEPRLNAFDDIVARTATAVPFAKAARSAVQTIDMNIPEYSPSVRFDTVLADNDNMISLDVDDRFIFVNRPGIWEFEAYFRGSPPNTVGNIIETAITEGGIGDVSFESEDSTTCRNGDAFTRMAYTRSVSQADIDLAGGFVVGVGANMFSGTVGGGIITIEYAELTAYWVADL